MVVIGRCVARWGEFTNAPHIYEGKESMRYPCCHTLRVRNIQHKFGRRCKIHPTSEVKMNISQVSFGCACEQTSEVFVKGSELR